MPTEKRVPAALHHELTEYSYLLRALRTQHVLDLSAHLSQAPSGQQSEITSGRESEDDGSLSVEEDDGGAFMSKRMGEADIATRQREDQPPIPQDEHEQDAALKQKRKREPTKTDRWTHWPLLAGDVNRPEFDLIDEVQLVASHVLKKRKITHKADGGDEITNNESDSDVSDSEASEDEPGDEYEEEELDDFASQAIAASTEGYLRSLLSACSALVPQVSISRRDRVSALNWVSVLSAAAACRLLSLEALECAGLRLQALYGDKQTGVSVPDSEQIAETKPYTLPGSVERHIHAIRTVKASQYRRNALLEERVKQGDGDFMSFVVPPRKKKKKTTSRKVRTRVEESDIEETAVKNERKGEVDEKESQTSESGLDELGTSGSEAGDKGEE